MIAIKKLIVTAILLAFVLLILRAEKTFALSCAELPTVEEAYQRYDGVIVGRVEHVKERHASNEVRLKVIKSFKGITQSKLSIDEDATWGTVRGPDQVGEEYLFFLSKKGNAWADPLCSPTKKSVDASSELAFLQNKEIPITNDPAAGENSNKLPAAMLWTIAGIIGLVVFIMLLIRKRKQNRR